MSQVNILVTVDINGNVFELVVLLDHFRVAPHVNLNFVITSRELDLVEEHGFPEGCATKVFGMVRLTEDVSLHILNLKVNA